MQLHELPMEYISLHVHLETLSVGRNKLSAIKNFTFVALPRLANINMEDNAISQVEAHSFYGLAKLRFLRLQSNRIMEINLGDIPPGAKVFLADNLLKSLDDLKGLRTSTHDMYKMKKYCMGNNIKSGMIKPILLSRLINSLCILILLFIF